MPGAVHSQASYADVERLRSELERKDAELEVAALQAELAAKQLMQQQLSVQRQQSEMLYLQGGGYQEGYQAGGYYAPPPQPMPPQPMQPIAGDLQEEAALANLIQFLRSPAPEEVLDALFTLSEMVNYSFDQDGARLGELMRTQGGLSQLSRILADPSQVSKSDSVSE